MHAIKVHITAEDFDKFIKEHLCKEDADKYADYEWVPAKIEVTEFFSIEGTTVPTK